MKLFFKLFIIFGTTSAFAQSIQTNVKEDKFNFSRAEIVKDSKGEMIIRGYDANGKFTSFISADSGFKSLKEMAKEACSYGPSSITASIGVISVTWEKSQLCDEKK